MPLTESVLSKVIMQLISCLIMGSLIDIDLLYANFNWSKLNLFLQSCCLRMTT